MGRIITSLVPMKLPEQNGLVIWLLGLSGAGKSTLANLLAQRLTAEGFLTLKLDGDEMRKGLNRDLGFSDEDRSENIRRAAETAKLLSANGIITICSFITPLAIHQQIAKAILDPFYFEVFIDCPLSICQQRDVKGLYKLANQNTIKNFTGIGSGFEKPAQPNLVLSTATYNQQQCLDTLYTAIIDKITGPRN